MMVEISPAELERMPILLREALDGYESIYDGRLKFLSFPPFSLTPQKPNTARTQIPVKYGDYDFPGGLTAVVFRPGDGTGDDSTFKLADLEIPKHLRYEVNPNKILPRKKDANKILCEGFFPFFSISGSGIHMFAASLDELVVDDGLSPRNIKKGWSLGLNPEEYKKALSTGSKIAPQIQYTTGYRLNGTRFGDPHAVHFGVDKDSIQVVGFFAISPEDNLHYLQMLQKSAPFPFVTDNWLYPEGVVLK